LAGSFNANQRKEIGGEPNAVSKPQASPIMDTADESSTAMPSAILAAASRPELS